MAETYKLTYFNARGAVEPIRFLLAYGGIKYEDHRIEMADWPIMKPTTKWGYLPLLEVNGESMGEIMAIERYLAKKLKLGGESAMEEFRADELVSAFMDVHKIRFILTETDPTKKEELKNAYINNIVKPVLAKATLLKEKNGGKWMVGQNLTWADFHIAYDLDCIESVDASVLAQFPAMKKLQETVHALPQIKAWIEKRPKTFM